MDCIQDRRVFFGNITVHKTLEKANRRRSLATSSDTSYVGVNSYRKHFVVPEMFP
jgi:hypothetical protein